MEEKIFDKDYINDYLENLTNTTEQELKSTEESIEKQLEVINKHLHKIEENIKLAEEEGDENLYNREIIKKQLILQKIEDLKGLSKIKKRR